MFDSDCDRFVLSSRCHMSDKSVSEKLQVKAERTLAVVNANPALDRVIGATGRRTRPEAADVVVLSVASLAELQAELPGVLLTLRASAMFWIAYPKRTSPMAGDLSRDVIHACAPSFGLDAVSQIAIDEDWSAMRFKHKREQ